MKRYTMNLSDPQADLANVGGKGMSLARMIRAGLPVPDGFHITTDAYRQFVTVNGIQQQIMEALKDAKDTSPDRLDFISQAIRRCFVEGEIPAEISSAISTACSALNGAPVAVRSSATAEDLPDASFAGQQETYLNIQGTEAVLEAVKQCWASLWTSRAIAYRVRNDIPQETVALAVVVQKLVFAEAAGVMFTANPINGKRDELVINAAWGLGEAVVSGAVTPDTITVKKDSLRVIRREISDKQVMTVRTEQGTHEAPVPNSRKKKAVLNARQTAELAGLGLKIERFYQMPMDVEWAFSNGTFAIVQARPITALPVEWKLPFVKAVYARGSLAEHIPGPVTPLFATLGLEIANIATAQMWDRVIGKAAKDLIVEGGFYLALNGYVYGGMYMTAKEMLAVIKMSLSQVGPMFRGSVARWQSAREKLTAVVQDWQAKPVESLSPTELLEGASTLFGAACRYFTDIQMTLPAASMSEVFFTRLYNGLIRRNKDPEALVFLLGFDTAALRAEKSLYTISSWIKENPALADYAMQSPTEILLEDLRQQNAPEHLEASLWFAWKERIQQHLKAFGRTAYEFDFANPTPFEAPGPIIEAIKSFLSGKAQNPFERQREAVEKREHATQAVLVHLGWPVRGWFTKMLRWAQETAPMREDSIYDMGMGHYQIRHMLGELGCRFAAGGAIDQPDDIFWLEKAEVKELAARLEAGAPLSEMAGRIPKRKAQWKASLKINPPVILPERSGWSKLMHGDASIKKDGKTVLKGVGTSSGTVTAPACVLFSPEDFGKMQPGSVLVAVTTTPAWTPLFSMASAVVTDIGGPLSHSSIVAREYGIPAVMAARSATRAIQTGQIITVDGKAGTVTIA